MDKSYLSACLAHLVHEFRYHLQPIWCRILPFLHHWTLTTAEKSDGARIWGRPRIQMVTSPLLASTAVNRPRAGSWLARDVPTHRRDTEPRPKRAEIAADNPPATRRRTKKRAENVTDPGADHDR